MLNDLVPNVVSDATEIGSVEEVKQQVEKVLNVFSLSDQKISDLIYASHVYSEKSFDEDALFLVVENILKRSTKIVDKLVQGSTIFPENNATQVKPPKVNLSVPLCTLKSINNELSCKAPGELIAHKTTLAILGKLSSYSWEAKAVLTLASFAMEFGDFWLLANFDQSDQLAIQLAVLKRVPGLTKTSELRKHREALLELNSVIKTVMRVVATLDEFEKLSIYDRNGITGLSVALDLLAVDVYWIILTIAACATKFDILISDNPEKPHDLAPYSQKIHFVLNKLNGHLTICRAQLAEAEALRRIRKLLRVPTEIMEIFKALIFTKDIPLLPLFDGSTNKTVSIEVLKNKNMYMFFSTLDISADDIDILKPVYDKLKSLKEQTYTLVWVPIVEKWTDELRKKFDVLRATMPWLVLQHFIPLAGFRFIKEDWQFNGKPTLVVIDNKGKIGNLNAFNLIKSWGLKAFPFDSEAEVKISKQINWFGHIAASIDASIETWIKEDKYIFFYGGKDKDLIQRLTEKITAITIDPFFVDLKINIELFWVGKTPKGSVKVVDHAATSKFWSAIETLFLSKTTKEPVVDPTALDIQKLLSFKSETAWAVLAKGGRAVTVGHGTAFVKVLEDLGSWRMSLEEKGFEFTFKEYHATVTQGVRVCTHFDVPIVAGKVPVAMKCFECTRTMDTYISYKCCHLDH